MYMCITCNGTEYEYNLYVAELGEIWSESVIVHVTTGKFMHANKSVFTKFLCNYVIPSLSVYMYGSTELRNFGVFGQFLFTPLIRL